MQKLFLCFSLFLSACSFNNQQNVVSKPFTSEILDYDNKQKQEVISQEFIIANSGINTVYFIEKNKNDYKTHYLFFNNKRPYEQSLKNAISNLKSNIAIYSNQELINKKSNMLKDFESLLLSNKDIQKDFKEIFSKYKFTFNEQILSDLQNISINSNIGIQKVFVDYDYNLSSVNLDINYIHSYLNKVKFNQNNEEHFLTLPATQYRSLSLNYVFRKYNGCNLLSNHTINNTYIVFCSDSKLDVDAYIIKN